MMKQMAKYIFNFILISIVIVAYSCKKNSGIDCSTYNYADCGTVQPDKTYLQVELTINNENQNIILTIYKGKIEDNNILLIDTVTTPYYEKEVAVNQYYSVSTLYKYGDKIIKAIDGKYLKSKVETVCDSSCWKTSGNNLDVRLRY